MNEVEELTGMTIVTSTKASEERLVGKRLIHNVTPSSTLLKERGNDHDEEVIDCLIDCLIYCLIA